MCEDVGAHVARLCSPVFATSPTDNQNSTVEPTARSKYVGRGVVKANGRSTDCVLVAGERQSADRLRRVTRSLH